MTTQYIQRMMAMTVSEILTALYNGLALFGCGLAGIPLTIEDLTDHESN
jgi:hypothetical protein